jgi:hypothetical protein
VCINIPVIIAFMSYIVFAKKCTYKLQFALKRLLGRGKSHEKQFCQNFIVLSCCIDQSATKVRDERRLLVTEIRMLRWICGVPRMDIIMNEYIRRSLKVAPVTKKMRSNWLAC